MNEKRILVIEDDDGIREAVLITLEIQGCVAKGVSSRDEAYAKIQSGWFPDVIFMDYWMPGMSPEDFIHKLRALLPTQPRLVLMTAGDADTRAKKLGITEILLKPFGLFDILRKIECSST